MRASFGLLTRSLMPGSGVQGSQQAGQLTLPLAPPPPPPPPALLPCLQRNSCRMLVSDSTAEPGLAAAQPDTLSNSRRHKACAIELAGASVEAATATVHNAERRVIKGTKGDAAGGYELPAIELSK